MGLRTENGDSPALCFTVIKRYALGLCGNAMPLICAESTSWPARPAPHTSDETTGLVLFLVLITGNTLQTGSDREVSTNKLAHRPCTTLKLWPPQLHCKETSQAQLPPTESISIGENCRKLASLGWSQVSSPQSRLPGPGSQVKGLFSHHFLH